MRSYPIRGTKVVTKVPAINYAVAHSLRSVAAMKAPGSKGLGILVRR